MPQTVDTKRVKDRRQLRFDSVAAVLNDLALIDASARAGTLRHSGNWSPSQILAHLASFIEFAYDGYPPSMSSPPWIIKLILKGMKKRYLYRSLPVGVRIPKVPGGTVGADDGPYDVASARLRRALGRLRASPPHRTNPIFGPLTPAEWTSLHCRHCELHFSFLHPD